MNRNPKPSSSSSQPSQSKRSVYENQSNEDMRLEDATGLDRIRVLSHLLDNAIPIPGTGYSFGLDPIIGLLPAGGDVVGTLLSAYIVLEASRFRLSVPTLTRMMFNILLEMIVGTVPLIGDLFDLGWKANAKNLKLIEAHLQHPDENQAADKRFFIILVIAFIIIIAVQISWYIAVFQFLANLFAS
ncbi:MAG: DUF4112 domain-containing protein [Cyanobacteria bacterium P01_E01_bin.6]